MPCPVCVGVAAAVGEEEGKNEESNRVSNTDGRTDGQNWPFFSLFLLRHVRKHPHTFRESQQWALPLPPPQSLYLNRRR